LRSAVRNHLIGIPIYALPFSECCLDFGVGRKLAGIGFGEPTLDFLYLPRFGFHKDLERTVNDPRSRSVYCIGYCV